MLRNEKRELLGLCLLLVVGLAAGCRVGAPVISAEPPPQTVAPTPTATVVVCVTEGTYETPTVSAEIRRLLDEEYGLVVLGSESRGLYICPDSPPTEISFMNHTFNVTLRVDDVHDTSELNRQLGLVGEGVRGLLPEGLLAEGTSLGGHWLNVTFVQSSSTSNESWERSIDCNLFDMGHCAFE